MDNNLSCVLLACAGGLCSSIGSAILARQTRNESMGRETGRVCGYINLFFNIAFGLAAVGFFILATGYGPVAVAMPLQVGFNLLTNMAILAFLRIKHYTKEMLVGTLVLVAAVASLVDIGPEFQEYDDPLALLTTPMAITWISICAVLALVMLVRVKFVKDLPIDSVTKLYTFSLVMASSNVLAASVGKLMQEASGAVLAMFLIVYFVMGAINFSMTTYAATVTDMTMLVPISACAQLTMNCITGLTVWQDYHVIHFWVSYIMVYILVILGAYLCASIDLLEIVAIRGRVKKTFVTEGVTVSSFGASVFSLYKIWQEPSSDDVPQAEAATEGLRLALQKGADKNMIGANELIEFIIMCIEKSDNISMETVPPTLVTWLENECEVYKLYVEKDIKFRQQLHEMAGLTLPNDVVVNVNRANSLNSSLLN